MKIIHVTQHSTEEGIYPIDWTVSLLAGVTVSSVAFDHAPPTGVDASITALIVTPISYVKVPAGLVTGIHKVVCTATTSDTALSPVVLLVIRVPD